MRRAIRCSAAGRRGGAQPDPVAAKSRRSGAQFRRRFWRAAEGLGAVEFGLLAPVVLLLLLGILDFGMGYWHQMQIANVANAGSQWGMSNAYDEDSIRTVATSATNLSGITVTPSNPCGCPGSTGVTVYPCGSTCPDDSVAKSYIVVDTRICYSTLFTWPGLPYCSSEAGSCSGCTASQIALSAQSILLK